MSRLSINEETLKFVPVFRGSETLVKIIRKNRFSPYKFFLFLHDLIVVFVAFGLGAWIMGVGFSMRDNIAQSITLFIFSLISIVFFLSYHLYNYHRIFFRRDHLISLMKVFCFSAATFGIIILLYLYPKILEKKAIIPFTLLAAIALLLLSRFFWDSILNILTIVGISFVIIGIVSMINPNEKPIIIINWSTVLLSFSLAVAIILVGRLFMVQVVFNKWMRRRFRRQIAIVGSDQEAKDITNHIINKNAPFWVSGIIGKEEDPNLDVLVPKNRLGELNDLPGIVQRRNIDEIIVTDENINKRILISLLDYCTSEGISVWFPPKLLPIIGMKLYIDNFCGLPMIRLCSQKNDWVFNKIKHGFDALVSLHVLLILLPIFFVLGIIIKKDSKGPIFYKAQAIGKNGKEFLLYKFRSMRVNNDCDIHKDYIHKWINGNIYSEGEKNRVFKITDDPRITSVGKVIRKFSLDELPQIINVLKGDMSLVGPRPCLPYEYEIYKDWHKKRLSIRPGMSGLWQVAGRSTVTFEDMILLDLYYVYNRSLLMDIQIIYETIFVVFGKKGAF